MLFGSMCNILSVPQSWPHLDGAQDGDHLWGGAGVEGLQTGVLGHPPHWLGPEGGVMHQAQHLPKLSDHLGHTATILQRPELWRSWKACPSIPLQEVDECHELSVHLHPSKKWMEIMGIK